MITRKSVSVIGIALTTAIGLIPFNGSPLLAQAVNQGSKAVQAVIAKPQINLNLAVDRQIQTTKNGKPTTQWQALDAKQAAVVPGNVLRYRLNASNVGNRVAKNFVITQPIPARTVFVGNSVSFGEKAGEIARAAVSYSVDQGKTFSAKPTVSVKGQVQPAPTSAYTHLRIQLNQPIAPQSAIAAQYQVRVQ
jgi:uncharacterized repeat protein (TIGR01451 family)